MLKAWQLAWLKPWPVFAERGGSVAPHPVLVLKVMGNGRAYIAPLSTKGELASVAIQMWEGSHPPRQPAGKLFPSILLDSAFSTAEHDGPLDDVSYLTLESAPRWGDEVRLGEEVRTILTIEACTIPCERLTPWHPLTGGDARLLYRVIPEHWRARCQDPCQ